MKGLLAIGLLSLAGCMHMPTGDSDRDVEGIRAATAAWVAAYNTRDPARITSAYAPDAVFWGTTSKTIRATPADVAEYFKSAANRPNARVRIADEHPRAWGSVGVNSGSYFFSDERDGQRTERPARFTMVFHRRDGKWVLVDHHSSEVK